MANIREEGVPFVRVSNLSPFEITEEKNISEDLYAEVRQHQPEQGEILFSKDGTPGIAHYLREQPPKMIPSGGVLRLKSKTDKVKNEYLALVLNSILTQEQVNRGRGRFGDSPLATGPSRRNRYSNSAGGKADSDSAKSH